MSNTRYAEPGEPLAQNRFASSAAFDTGLLGNLVARRCEKLEKAEDRELVWFLQWVSHQAGGLRRFVRVFCQTYAEQIATRAMQRLGFKAGQIYNAEQVRAVRAEFPLGEHEDDFLLKGEEDLMSAMGYKRKSSSCLTRSEAARRPNSYPAEKFVRRCQEAVATLEARITDFCLNPEVNPDAFSPWFFPNLIQTLHRARKAHATQLQACFVETDVSEAVESELDYALETGCMVIIEGRARLGKSSGARHWCDARPGRIRYVQVPPGNDEKGFYRVVAQALGVSSGLSMKGSQIRERIENTLQGRDIMIVFDETHYLWPQTLRRPEASPIRLSWIMTALINKGVSVGLVTTPQFSRNQKQTEKSSGWTSEQLVGRTGHYKKLPMELSHRDLVRVVKAHVPELDEEIHEMLAKYAAQSMGYVAGIEHVVKRARFVASRQGRTEPTFADIDLALTAAPESDAAFTGALNEASVAIAKKQGAEPIEFSVPKARKRTVRVNDPTVSNGASRAPAGKT